MSVLFFFKDTSVCFFRIFCSMFLICLPRCLFVYVCLLNRIFTNTKKVKNMFLAFRGTVSMWWCVYSRSFFFVFFSESELRREISRLGTTAARLKPKGIDGGLHKRWSMWFNSTQRAKPYQFLT